MDITLCVITTVTVFILIAYWYTKKSFSYWKSYNVPHNTPTFPHGNMKDVGKTMTFLQFLKNHYDQFNGTSKMCGIYFFMQPISLLLDLDVIKHVLVNDFKTFNDRNFYYNDKDDPLSAHLAALDGENWRNIRAKLTPTFTSGKMRCMFYTIAQIGDRLTHQMNEGITANGNELDIKNLASRFTMDVIGACAFGLECNTLSDTNNDFHRYGRMAMEKPRHSARITFLLSEMKSLARFLGIKMVRDDVSAFFMNMVRRTIDYREKNNIQRSDFLDLLINLRTDDNESDTSKGLTVNQIAAQSFLFFTAGFETSSTTMLFTLYELAVNQDIQEKLRQEIQKSFEKHDEYSYEMMMDIPYLDQTIKGKNLKPDTFCYNLNVFLCLQRH